MTPRLPLTILMLHACALTEDTFGERVAAVHCPNLKACDEDLFFDTYLEGSSMCRLEIADDVNDLRYGGGISACSWLPDEAQACMDAMNEATCDDTLNAQWFSRCVSAWDCVAIVNQGR